MRSGYPLEDARLEFAHLERADMLNAQLKHVLPGRAFSSVSIRPQYTWKVVIFTQLICNRWVENGHQPEVSSSLIRSTYLHEGGKYFSTVQRLRLAIARALVRDALPDYDFTRRQR